MQPENLIDKGLLLENWSCKTIARFGDVKARLFHLTPDKEMILFEEGHVVDEWILVLFGNLLVQTPDKTLVLNVGDSLIVSPHVSHKINVDIETIIVITRDMKQAPPMNDPEAVLINR